MLVTIQFKKVETTAENKFSCFYFTSWYMYLIPIHYGSGRLSCILIWYLPWKSCWPSIHLLTCSLWIQFTFMLLEHHRHYMWMGWLAMVETHIAHIALNSSYMQLYACSSVPSDLTYKTQLPRGKKNIY